ncbi:MAG: ugp [Limisphaerales bacterium]|nr:MAG: ugp [Limisphaerales bacterium]KAG0510743.1 MAG: ugp [Limisphaerales bacterium]TXT52639.1 MAG: ugp [Limisphaerales bacterium]
MLVDLVTARKAAQRNASLDAHCRDLNATQLLAECGELDAFRRRADNLYERVRALFFLYAIHRFHLPAKLQTPNSKPETSGLIPFPGYEQLLHRRFEEAIDTFLAAQEQEGPSDGLCSALANAYHRLAFQTLADQVRRSVRSVRGNQWMFRVGHPADQPLRLRPELLQRSPDGTYPILREQTPVRMDLTHSAWSDIFFLGMDFPEGAKVLNVSVDLGIHGRDAAPRPPVSAWLRVLDEPVLRLTSVDLGATADLTALSDVFDFAKDYLGLLKAAVIAAGVVPPGIEGSGQSLAELLARIVGPGRGLELVSCVNDIPKGSRLAVSTNLLGSLVSVLMRATGQAASLTGELQENERRIVLARALLGEWLGGSGGGWQDSGGVWPGMKLIEGVIAGEGDPEFGISRGRLMPQHRILSLDDASAETRRKLQDSLVLVHGGMAQNVGPILEMVTEKYLLRCEAEWRGRQDALRILDEVLAALKSGDIRALGAATTRNFREPIQAIIPWASTAFTEQLIERVGREFGDDFWGFWMLGGMSGGGMGFIIAPHRKVEGQQRLQEIMSATKRELQHALPFAMEPVVFDYAINERGTWADLLTADAALMPAGYYALTVPKLLRTDRQELPAARRAELDKFAAACRAKPELRGMVQTLFDTMFPRLKEEKAGAQTLDELLAVNGFDREAHEAIRTDLKAGRIGLAQNRLPANTVIEDVRPQDVTNVTGTGQGGAKLKTATARGLAALRNGEAAVVTLSAGAASRWTQGAGVVKSLHPFCKLGGRHRTFLEVHLAKSRKISRLAGQAVPHILTTSYLTHQPLTEFLATHQNYGYEGPLLLSRGASVGLRLVPTARDLRFAWEEMPQQVLDEQQQKVRDSLRAALLRWAESAGEATDYRDNLPLQCLHPVGHFYEVPNLLRNGTLAALLRERPQLKTLLLHNIDTTGANLDPALLGQHLASGATLSFEVITRRLEDRGGGLARVDGRTRLVEGLAMPHEELEFGLSYYNTLTTWIDVDGFLRALHLTRDDILAADDAKIAAAIRALAAKVPTYITTKDVKKRWGHGQEDVFPVAQFEKLWGDLTALAEIDSRFLVVSRLRGQQLKDQAQLDGWLRDGSAAYVENLCAWD